MEHDLCYGCMEHTAPNGPCPKCGFDPAAYTTEPHQLKPGTLLKDRYAVGRVLGEGGFGITYVGRDTLLDLKVAIKEFYMSGYVNRNNTYSTVVQASMGTHAETFAKNREKFLQEARVLAKFATEDGIVGIRDFFQENNTAYIVMDFLSGGTMRDYLNRVGTLTWEQTHRILKPILRSLGNVHSHDIIHRDISPDNIMMTGDGKVKLLDFGAAREISKTDIKSLSVILKPGYAPEEQYRSKGQQGPWTDIYALCATMYRCMTGEVPDDSMERMYNDQVKSPYERGVCPVAISNVLMKGLSVRQAGRYQSIAELCADLERAEQDPDNAAIAAPTAPQVQRPVDSDATVYAGGSTPAAAVQNEPVTDPDATVFAGVAADPGAHTVPGKTEPATHDPNATVFARDDRNAATAAEDISAADELLVSQGTKKSTTKAPTKVPGKEKTRTPAKAKPGLMHDVISKADEAASGAAAPKQQPKPQSKQPRQEAAFSAGTASAPENKTPGVKKTKGKKLLFLLIPVALILLVVLISSLGGGKDPSGEMPAPFNEYSFTLNDKTYELPMMIDELIADGWIPEDESVLSKDVSPWGYGDYITLTNGYGDISVNVYNPTDSTHTNEDCAVSYIHIGYYGLTTNYLNEVRNSAGAANGLVMGEATESEFTSRAPKGYGVDKSYDHTYSYTSEADGSYYELQFDKDSKLLEGLTIRVDVPDGFISNAYLKSPPEFDEEAFEQNAQLQWLFKAGDVGYATSVYVSDLLNVGWEMERGPEFIASGSYDYVYLRANTLTTMQLQVYNHFDSAVVPEYCFVESCTIYDTDIPSDATGVLSNADGSISITTEMPMSEVMELLDTEGIYYEQDGDDLYIYPYGEGDSRCITLSYLVSGAFYCIKLDASEAIRTFFAK